MREHIQVWRERKDLALIIGHFELKRLGAARHEVVNGEGCKGHERFGLRFVGGHGRHGHEALFEILGNNVASCVHRRLERAERGLCMCVREEEREAERGKGRETEKKRERKRA